MLTKGALHILNGNTVKQSIVFQYNPDKVSRTIQPKLVGGNPRDHAADLRLGATPEERFSLSVSIDALDNLPTPSQNKAAPQDGIYPILSAIELQMAPDVATIRANQQKLASGTIQIGPYPAPSLLLDWGQKRIVPVIIEGYSVEEQFFDAGLAPMRAVVQLQLRVVTTDDVQAANQLARSYLSYQQFKQNEAGKL